MTGQKVLVLGATGLIGSAVAIRLAADNELHGVSRATDEAAASRVEQNGVKLIRADVVKDGLAGLDTDYDYIFNEILLQPHLCDKDADLAFETHAFLNVRLIECYHSCKGIVLGSTGSVYRPSAEPATEDSPLGCNPFPSLENYVLSKICADKMIEYLAPKFDARVAILRYYHPYDTSPRARIGSLVGKITQGRPIIAGDSLANPMFVDDMADMTIRAAEVCASPPEIISVGGDEIVSARELAVMVGEALGKKPELTDSSESASASWVCDSTKRIRLLGTEQVSLAEGIARTIAELKTR